MGAKGNTRHLKRLNLPKYVQVARKQYTFFFKANAGPHPGRFCLPLGHVVRDLMAMTKTDRETKFILMNGDILVDGKVQRDTHYPVGLMDVVAFPKLKKYYRVVPHPKKALILHEISEAESKYKLCQIRNKTTIRGGHVQLNLHDGRNIVIQVKDAKKKDPVEYKTMGSVKIELPTQKILDYYPLNESCQGLIFKGRNAGEFGKVSQVKEIFGVNASVIEIDSVSGRKSSSSYDYIIVIGKTKPMIDLPKLEA